MLRRVRDRAESMTRSPRRSNGSPYDCNKCNEKDAEIVALKDTISALEDETQANKECVQVLQMQIDGLNQVIESLQATCRSHNVANSIIETLCAREREAGEAASKLKQLETEVEKVTSERSSLVDENKKMEEKVKLFEQIIGDKDRAVMNLVNQVFELENGTRRKGTSISLSQHDLKELETLRDSVRAYQEQIENMSKASAELYEQKAATEQRLQKLQLEGNLHCVFRC